MPTYEIRGLTRLYDSLRDFMDATDMATNSIANIAGIATQKTVVTAEQIEVLQLRKKFGEAFDFYFRQGTPSRTAIPFHYVETSGNDLSQIAFR